MRKVISIPKLLKCTSVIFVVIFHFSGLLAQYEANMWYFGRGVALNFNSGAPVSINNSKMYTWEGSSSISTDQGRLLFYTDGITVWDSTNFVMSNGSGLLGHSSSAQAALIVKKPGSNKIYYLFTTDAAENSNCQNGLNYSEVDMSLNGGKGAINSVKNVQLLSYSSENLTGVIRNKDSSVWILTTRYNTDSLFAFLVTKSGINKTPVKSKIKTKFKKPAGCMKFSPSGGLLAIANNADSVTVYKFDQITGKASHWCALGSTFSSPYGVEFSASGNFIYIGDMGGDALFQFDMRSGIPSTIIASRRLLSNAYSASTNNALGSLQIGPDKKIYCTQANANYLHCIEYPDSAGTKCSYKSNYVYLGGVTGRFAWWGLPSFLQSYFGYHNIEAHHTCSSDTSFFNMYNNLGIDSVKWDFGDPNSGGLNSTKKQSNVYHIYKKPGVYKVKLISYFGSYNDTTSRDFYISDSKPHLGKDSTYCNAVFALLSPSKNFVTYKWNVGPKVKSIIETNVGTYILNTMDSSGCKDADTINIYKSTVKAAINSLVAWCGNSVLKIKDATGFVNDSRKKTNFYFSDGQTSIDTILAFKTTTSDSIGIKLKVQSVHGCFDSTTKLIKIFPSPNYSIKGLKDSTCFTTNGFKFQNLSTIKYGTFTGQWDFGNGTTDTAYNPAVVNYANASVVYKLQYQTITNNSCKDTFFRNIKILEVPRAGMSVKKITQCLNQNAFEVINLASFSNINKIKYAWYSGAGDSTKIKSPPPFVYKNAGKYTLTFIVTSASGCSDTSSSQIEVRPSPNAKIAYLKDSICEKQSFLATSPNKSSTDISTWIWNGSGIVHNDSFRVTLPTNGKYSLMHILENTVNCKDTFQKTIVVSPNPTALFALNDTIICSGRKLIATTSNYKAGESIGWFINGKAFGVGKQLIYGKPDTGMFSIQSISINQYKCSDTSNSKFRVISNPKSLFTLSDTAICEGQIFKATFAGLGDSGNWNFNGNNFLKSGTVFLINSTQTESLNGKYYLTLQMVNANGCRDTSVKSIRIEALPMAKFDWVNVCYGKPFIPQNNSTGNITKWKWMLTDTAFNIKNPIFTFKQPGNHQVKLSVKTPLNCADSTTKLVVVYSNPKPLVNISGTDYQETDNYGYQFHSEPDTFQIYQWKIGNTSGITDRAPKEYFHIPDDTILVHLRVVSAVGCEGTTDTKFVVKGITGYYFPNSFTPNGDGINDGFGIAGPEYVKSYKLWVINRWGQVVFYTENPAEKWKPNKAVNGMYVYKAKIQDIYSRWKEVHGTVFLVE